jgi:capsule polysaccharide export protein KpsE/RkpR
MAKYDFEARDALRGATVISEDIRSGVISISVQDRDPKRACDIAQAYVDELDNSVVKLNTSAAHRERVFIEQRLNSVKEGLDSASNKLGEFGSSNATMNPQEQGTLTMSTAAKIEEDLTVAQAELGGLEQVYTKDNTRVRELQARVGELEKKLQEIGGKGPIKSSDGVYPSIRELPLMAVTYDDLLRSTKLQAALYETLAKEYESAKIEEAKEIPSISMLDPPAIAERKSGPPRRAIIVGGTVAALLLGIICLLLPLAVVQIDLECVRYVIGNEAYAKLAVFVKRVEEWNGNG